MSICATVLHASCYTLRHAPRASHLAAGNSGVIHSGTLPLGKCSDRPKHSTQQESLAPGQRDMVPAHDPREEPLTADVWLKHQCQARGVVLGKHSSANCLKPRGYARDVLGLACCAAQHLVGAHEVIRPLAPMKSLLHLQPRCHARDATGRAVLRQGKQPSSAEPARLRSQSGAMMLLSNQPYGACSCHASRSSVACAARSSTSAVCRAAASSGARPAASAAISAFRGAQPASGGSSQPHALAACSSAMHTAGRAHSISSGGRLAGSTRVAASTQSHAEQQGPSDDELRAARASASVSGCNLWTMCFRTRAFVC